MGPHSPPVRSRRARQSAPFLDIDADEPPRQPSSQTTLAPERASEWSFLTKHAHVLICLEENPQTRIRALALRIGMSPRAVLRILDDLEEAQYITRRRERRGTRYEVHRQQKRQCPVVGDLNVHELLRLIHGGAL